MAEATMRRRPLDQPAEAPQPPQPGDAPLPRQLARDTTTGRTGHIMHIARVHGTPIRISLRPVDGGLEWDAEPRHVEPVDSRRP